MRIWHLAWLPLMAATAPVWGQVERREECPVDIWVALAESAPGGIIGHCSIVVTGNLHTSTGEITENIVTIQRSSGRLENRFLEIPGLQQFRRSDARSANPTSQGVTLRGLGGNASSRALLFLDDVPQADPFGGWVSWPSYDALNLASIRVRRGAGQIASGPGALGGVIELDSKQNVGEFGARLAYGSRNSVDAKAGLIRKLGVGSVSVSGSYARGDGFVPIIASQRGAVSTSSPKAIASLACGKLRIGRSNR